MYTTSPASADISAAVSASKRQRSIAGARGLVAAAAVAAAAAPPLLAVLGGGGGGGAAASTYAAGTMPFSRPFITITQPSAPLAPSTSTTSSRAATLSSPGCSASKAARTRAAVTGSRKSDGARPVRPVDFVVARHQPSGASLGTTVSRSPSSNESSAASSAAKPAAATWRPGVMSGIARGLRGAERVVRRAAQRNCALAGTAFGRRQRCG